MRALRTVLALTVAAALAGCTTAIDTPEALTPPGATTQPNLPSVVTSAWSPDEVTVLTTTTSDIALTVTVWDGQTLAGPTPHPLLGGGGFTITMRNEWYNNPDIIAVPFRIEIVNIRTEVQPGAELGGFIAPDTEVYLILEGASTEWKNRTEYPWAGTLADIEPGQTLAAAGYLLLPVENVFVNDYARFSVGAAFLVGAADVFIDAGIGWNDPLERYMPHEAIIKR